MDGYSKNLEKIISYYTIAVKYLLYAFELQVQKDEELAFQIFKNVAANYKNNQ